MFDIGGFATFCGGIISEIHFSRHLLSPQREREHNQNRKSDLHFKWWNIVNAHKIHTTRLFSYGFEHHRIRIETNPIINVLRIVKFPFHILAESTKHTKKYWKNECERKKTIIVELLGFEALISDIKCIEQQPLLSLLFVSLESNLMILNLSWVRTSAFAGAASSERESKRRQKGASQQESEWVRCWNFFWFCKCLYRKKNKQAQSDLMMAFMLCFSFASSSACGDEENLNEINHCLRQIWPCFFLSHCDNIRNGNLVKWFTNYSRPTFGEWGKVASEKKWCCHLVIVWERNVSTVSGCFGRKVSEEEKNTSNELTWTTQPPNQPISRSLRCDEIISLQSKTNSDDGCQWRRRRWRISGLQFN